MRARQNLMLAALHGASQGLVSNIRRVLGELHRAKRLGGPGSVDGMLVRLYEPVLFRALAAANAAVRRNALQLLLDAFPLLVRAAALACTHWHTHVTQPCANRIAARMLSPCMHPVLQTGRTRSDAHRLLLQNARPGP